MIVHTKHTDTLYMSFLLCVFFSQGLSEAMTLLLSLADKRQRDLTDHNRKERVLSALTRLKVSLTPLSEAMKKYVRNPTDVPTQVSIYNHACNPF